LLSAQHLRVALAEKELKLRFTMPIYYLYSNAPELTPQMRLRLSDGVGGGQKL
jgi:hypothetical protein